MKEAACLVVIFNFIFFVLTPKSICYSKEPATGEFLKSQEALEKERELRKRIEGQGKIYIKKIVVEGVRLIPHEELKEIILPFEKKWLSQNDIHQIIFLIKTAYKNKGHSFLRNSISHEIRKSELIIKIKE